MSPSRHARIGSASPQFFEHASHNEIRDWLTYFDPDVVLLTGETPARRAERALRRVTTDIALCHPASSASANGPRTIGGIQFVFAPDTQTLADLPAFERNQLDTSRPTYVLSNLLELDIDRTALSTALRGRETYLTALSPERLEGEYVHISMALPAGYRGQWGELTVVGGGRESGYASTPLYALDCGSDGRVVQTSLKRSNLGLGTLDGVGDTRARRLRDAGFERRADVAEATVTQLAEIQGLGQSSAKRIHQSATAIAEGKIVRTSERPLPDGDPVYIDIETDGLNPTITWLIGVLDGSRGGEFVSFLQTDPDDPGRAIEEFLAWYRANAGNRPLVAYNGLTFDFQVLEDHIREYCPEYIDVYENIYRFDPYAWAIKDGNAILPGRSNTLESVATALGYDRAGTGLTGQAVARAYQEWMVERSPDAELDWDRFEAYCEDDVRALARIYEALRASRRVVSTGDHSPSIDETTTQGNLSDW